jgi:hypothetical protein
MIRITSPFVFVVAWLMTSHQQVEGSDGNAAGACRKARTTMRLRDRGLGR